jgi:hypothetical protein
VIYLDSSVALAHLLAEDRFPAEDLWRQQLVSSRNRASIEPLTILAFLLLS